MISCRSPGLESFHVFKDLENSTFRGISNLDFWCVNDEELGRNPSAQRINIVGRLLDLRKSFSADPGTFSPFISSQMPSINTQFGFN